MNLKKAVTTLAATAALFLLGVVPRARAATFNIANGDVTALKAAITTANTNNVADTINLAANGTYTLTTVDNTTRGTNGLPAIIDDLAGLDLTINGNGSTIQRSTATGTAKFRFLEISTGATTTFSGLTFKNGIAYTTGDGSDGSAGGGEILNLGANSISNCTFNGGQANQGGAIANVGTMSISGSTFDGNSALVFAGDGGAILTGNYFGAGNLTVSDCRFGNNTANEEGGAFYVTASNGANTLTVSITNCTFSNNTLNGNLSSTYGGGAIVNEQGVMTLTNSTFSANEVVDQGVGGALINDRGTTHITNCTFNDNVAGTGSAIISDSGQSTATVTLGNTIVKGNASTLVSFGGTITSQGYNLSSDNGGGFLTAATDQPNTDPKLVPLANNGGPTQTCALLSGSPALDKGKSFGATTDQRGLARPYDNPAIANATGGDGSDIGAFETQAVPPTLAVNNPRSLPEGNVGSSGSVTFDITLSAASTQSVTVNFQTHNGTNNPAIAGTDYVEKHGKLTFAPGETDKRVTISFIGDSTVELNETFFFDLLTPTNATISDSRGVGQINNDDGPGITIDNAITVNEGSAGTSSQNFTVHLSAASADTITVNYATADQTAIAASDYVAQSGTLTFAPGETSKTVTVLVKGDTTVEPNETYKVVLSKVTRAFIADGTGVGTIRNDDAAPQVFQDEPSQ